MEDCLRIGQFKPTRHREEFREMWADGWAFEEISKAQQRIANERNEIINASQNLRKRKPTGNARDLKRYKIRNFLFTRNYFDHSIVLYLNPVRL